MTPLERFQIAEILYKLLSKLTIAAFNFRNGDIKFKDFQKIANKINNIIQKRRL